MSGVSIRAIGSAMGMAVIAFGVLTGPSVRGEVKAVPVAADDPRMLAGQAIFTDTCMACHRASGAGVANLFPRLAKNDVVLQEDASWPIVMVLQGGRVAATETAAAGPAMPALGWRLSDRQVADVLTYVRNSWGNAAPAVSARDVEKLRR